MATAEQVVDIQRLRRAIGVVGDDQDATLISYRNTAISVVEKYLNRYIIDRTGFESESYDFGYRQSPESLIFFVPDIKANPDGDDIVVHYRDADDDPAGKTNQTLSFELTDDRIGFIGRGRDGIYIYSDGVESWDSILRTVYPTPYIRCNVGMSVDDIPSAWGDAVSLIVRALLDGSAYDDLGKMSILNVVLGPWKPTAYMENIR